MRKMAHSCAGTLLAALCLIGLAAAGAQAADDISRIREKAAEMIVAVNEARFAPLIDAKDSDMEDAFDRYGYLLTDAKFGDLAKLVAEASDNPAEEALRTRVADILRYYAIRQRVAPLMDNFRNVMRESAVSVEGTRVVLQGQAHLIGLEANRDSRRKWWLGTTDLYTRVNVYLRSLLMDLDMHAEALGAEDYFTFLERLEGWDLDLMHSTAESVLETTKANFETGLTQLAKSELDLELRKIRTYDAYYLFFLPSLSAKVEKFKPYDVAKETFKDFGFDLKKQRMIKIDVREKEGRYPEARAYPHQTGKAEVTMVPSGMISDIQDLMGAIGEAEFYFLTPGDIPFEDAYVGSNLIPSTYRALCEMIVEEPAWVSKHLKLKGATPEEVADAFKLRRLYHMREAAGNFLYQLRIYENHSIDPDTYNDAMEAALLWGRTRNDADTYLFANDEFRSGGRVMGYVIAAQICDALRAEWGPEWFKNDALADKLEAGAAKGYRMDLNEFLALWNLASVDPSVLTAQLH